MLLDVCGLAKEDTRQLRPVFRRRRDNDAGFANVAKAYIASRKKANKLINKSLKDLKISKCGAHNDAEATFSMFRDVQGVTLSVLQSVFRYTTASIPEPKSTNWSLVSKLMHSKRVTREERALVSNEFERVMLKSNGVATSSSSSITEKLNGLRDLYELVDSWLQLPSTKNSLAQSCNDNELLNGSLRLLDVCGLAKDAFLQAKENTQQLQSVFRKRRAMMPDSQMFANGVTFAVLESLFHHITVSVPEPKSTNWSLVSKLMHPRRVTREGRASGSNEFERVNTMLCSLIGSKTMIENVQVELQNLESSIRDVEGDVECLMRLLIKTRVSILNILSH
ncbi:hypothetical protein GQ457_06G001800 [Hibiscus cannabinus]